VALAQALEQRAPGRGTRALSPSVSVALPVRDGAPFIADAVRSVLAQTHHDLELVVCDNHSTDETGRLLAAFDDPRLRVVRPPQALPMALSHDFAVRSTTARLVAIMGADDVADPRRIAAQVAALASDPALVLVGCWCETIDEAGRATGGLRYPAERSRVRREALRANPIVLPSMLLRRTAYDAVGGFRDEFGYAFDYDLVLRLLRMGEVANVSEDLLRYRYRTSGSSFRKIKEIQREGFRVRWAALRRDGYGLRDYVWLLQPLLALAVPSAVLRAIAVPYMNFFHGRR